MEANQVSMPLKFVQTSFQRILTISCNIVEQLRSVSLESIERQRVCNPDPNTRGDVFFAELYKMMKKYLSTIKSACSVGRRMHLGDFRWRAPESKPPLRGSGQQGFCSTLSQSYGVLITLLNNAHACSS